MALATITAVSPAQGPAAGPTAVTVTGTGFAHCYQTVYVRVGTGAPSYGWGVAAGATDTQMTATFRDMTAHPGLADVGVWDPTASPAAYVWKLGAFYVGVPPATLASVAPVTGPLTGGTVITVTGALLTQATGVYLRSADGWQVALPATTQTATTMAATTPDMTGHGGPLDVGVYDATAGVWVWLPAAFYAGTNTANPAGVWDVGTWDSAIWQQRRFAPGAGWGFDWQVWYQYPGQPGRTIDLTDRVVEVRWSTDAHAAGDGTYRGDIQPGTLQMQLRDPGHQLETLTKLGTIWLHYTPANYTWGFYLETVTRQLVAPGDSTAATVVVAGSPWPLRLNTDCTYNFPRPAERADTRLNAIATFLNQNANLALPRYTANIAAQSHQVTPTVPVAWASTAYPSALALIRAAAANGVAWVSAAVDGAGLGYFVLNYARWEAGTARNLTPSDIVAGIPFDSSMDDVITLAEFDATAAGGTTAPASASAATIWNYGLSKVTMRLWADVATVGSPDITPVALTAAALLARHGNPTVTKLSAITAASGQRTHPSGTDGPPWNPAAHVWSPVDIVNWVPPPGSPPPGTAGAPETRYWVTQTAHRLRAAAWESAHTVELQTAATPLPA